MFNLSIASFIKNGYFMTKSGKIARKKLPGGGFFVYPSTISLSKNSFALSERKINSKPSKRATSFPMRLYGLE